MQYCKQGEIGIRVTSCCRLVLVTKEQSYIMHWDFYGVGEHWSLTHCGSVISHQLVSGASPETEPEGDKMNLVDKAMQTEGEEYGLVSFFLYCPSEGTVNP